MDDRPDAKDRAALEKALKPYIAKATKQGRRRPAASAKKTARRAERPARTDVTAVRDRAKSNGHQVSDRGRISAAAQQAYDAAH